MPMLPPSRALLLLPSFASSDSPPFEFAGNFHRSTPANSPSLKQVNLADDAVCVETSPRVKFPDRQENPLLLSKAPLTHSVVACSLSPVTQTGDAKITY